MAVAAQKLAKPRIFVWEGSDRQGRRIKGQTRADSPALVRAELRKQGIRPIKIRKKATELFSARKKKITPKDIAVFSRQLSTMMYAGVPLVQAFDIIGRGHEKPSMQVGFSRRVWGSRGGVRAAGWNRGPKRLNCHCE